MYTSVDKSELRQSINVHADRMTLRRALRAAGRRVLHPSDTRIINSFPMFNPASAGSVGDLAALAIEAAEQIFPLALPIWQLTAAIVPQQFEAKVVLANKAALFAVQRLA
jgi:hypothetical protein